MRYLHHVLVTAGTLALAGLLLSAPAAEAKRRPVVEPDLRIVQVVLSNANYVPGQGMLDLAVEIELPSEMNGEMLLEVSSLISSPSQRSMRFLSTREPVPTPPSEGSPRMTVTLSWDGADQHEKPVGQGVYTYEIKAKLLAVGEKGPRTLMLSWPKRGTIEVK